jgi:hypothetical protein
MSKLTKEIARHIREIHFGQPPEGSTTEVSQN